MKSLYKCDKCGKVFDDYEECYNHEYSHWNVRRGYSTDDELLDSMTEYKEGQEEPNVIHIVFERWDNEKCEYIRRWGKYKLVSSYEAPLIIKNE